MSVLNLMIDGFLSYNNSLKEVHSARIKISVHAIHLHEIFSYIRSQNFEQIINKYVLEKQ